MAYACALGVGAERASATCPAPAAPVDPPRIEEKTMTVCPIAIVAGCKKCPAFAICPLKSVIGDYMKEPEKPAGGAAAKGRTGAKRAK
jgi:hypothetical protein